MLHVAVAVIRDDHGRILLSRRLSGVHLEGMWEFPGGKLEPGESLEQGLAREIKEELGVQVHQHRPLIRIKHHYPEKSVLLDVHLVDAWGGVPEGLEGQEIAWVGLDAIANYELPPADKPIVAALKLPSIYRITPRDVSGMSLASYLRQSKQESMMLQLRLPDLPTGEVKQVAKSIQADFPFVDLLVKELDLALELDCGLHLRSGELMQLTNRPLPENQWLAASCHDLDEIQHAYKIGADFITLSPVLPTASHPGAETLGWKLFSQYVDETPLPVYALGGMSGKLLPDAWKAGAQGVAGIRGFWDSILEKS